MRRPIVLVSMIAVLVLALPARADIWDDAYSDARNPRNQSGTSSTAAVSLMNVNSANTVEGVYAPSRPANSGGIAYFTDDNVAAYNPESQSNTFGLPAQTTPWGWSWFPYYHAALSFWKTSYENAVPMSPLEKYDTFAANRGSSEPYAAAFEAADNRPWIAQARGLPRGHNLAAAVRDAGNKLTIPWNVDGQGTQQMDVSWWGHCNGWAAAAVSFSETDLSARTVALAQNKLRFLRRPPFYDAASDPGQVSGGLAGCYDERPASNLKILTEDLKSILTEYGMQLRPSPQFAAGLRYDAPISDIEEYFFERRPDGTVVIPMDAQMMWVSLVFDGKNVGGWMIPKGVAEQELQAWRVQVEQYYRYYYPGRQIYTLTTVRYTNLPISPTVNDLRDLPPLIRKKYLDSAPLDVHDKMVKAFSGNGGTPHGMICEVVPGSQVWNYPVKGYQYQMSAIGEMAYDANLAFAPGRTDNPSALFNLNKFDKNQLADRGGQKALRYRIGTMRISMQEFDKVNTRRYEFIAFYGQGDRPIGSSWTGPSLTEHPDFVWYPDLDNPGDPNGGNPYIKAADLKVMAPNLKIR
jgi:hypothetical protein